MGLSHLGASILLISHGDGIFWRGGVDIKPENFCTMTNVSWGSHMSETNLAIPDFPAQHDMPRLFTLHFVAQCNFLAADMNQSNTNARKANNNKSESHTFFTEKFYWVYSLFSAYRQMLGFGNNLRWEIFAKAQDIRNISDMLLDINRPGVCNCISQGNGASKNLVRMHEQKQR